MKLYECRYALDLGEVSGATITVLRSRVGEVAPRRVEVTPEHIETWDPDEENDELDRIKALVSEYGPIELEWIDRPVTDMLHIHFIEVRNLLDLDAVTDSDPYAEVRIVDADGDVEHLDRTPIAMDKDAVRWNKRISSPIAAGDILHIDVLDFDRLSTDDTLGDFEMDPFSVHIGERVLRSGELEGVAEGEVEVEVERAELKEWRG